MKVKFYAPSYRRPEKAKTQIIYPAVKLVVMESEAEAYTANGNNIVVCPDSAQGNVSRIRNYIIDTFMEDNDAICIIDDDCSWVGRWNAQMIHKLDMYELQEFAEKHTFLCREWGFKHWGLNCATDKGSYREYSPFGTLQYIPSPICFHLKGTVLRYDEEIPLKEDYDMTLQHIRYYGGALRVNYARYEVKQAKQEGGCATMRNLDVEKAQFRALQMKWGKDVIRQDMTSKRKFDFNPIMKVPLKGM